MRTRTYLALATCWFTATAHAGLYNPAEPLDVQVPNLKMLSMDRFDNYRGSYGEFRNRVLEPLRSIAMPKVQLESPLRLRYRMMTGAKGHEAGYPQQLSLSEYMIRRNDANLHIQVTRLLENFLGDKNAFLALANLGTEYQMTGDHVKAARALQECLDAWPKEWEDLQPELKKQLQEMRWTQMEFEWFRQVETYQLKLAELRAKEQVKRERDKDKAKRDERVENVDAIFGDIFTFAPGEEYLPGKLPPGKTLPPDALKIVQQMVVWLPHDRRLQWLLGEVYNATGDIASARDVMKELGMSFSVSPYRPRLLTEHLQILSKAPIPPTDKKTDPMTFTLQHLVIAFGLGVVLTFFAYWQIREIGRRRARNTK